MLTNILTQIIASTFRTNLGKNTPSKVMVLHFSVSVADEFEGYARWTMILWAPSNYLEVWVRKEWNQVPAEGLDGDDDLKPGFEYKLGAEPWTILISHDSGWRSTIQDFINQHRHEFLTLNEFGTHDWFSIAQVPRGGFDTFGDWLKGKTPMSDWK